jgi:hypothetical protein
MNASLDTDEEIVQGQTPSLMGRNVRDPGQIQCASICVYDKSNTTSSPFDLTGKRVTPSQFHRFPHYPAIGSSDFTLDDGYLSPASSISDTSSTWSQPDSVSSHSSINTTMPFLLPPHQEPGYFQANPWVIPATINHTPYRPPVYASSPPSNPPAPRHSVISLKSRSDEGKHQCQICERRFLRPSALKIHRRVHSREKPFPCPVGGCSRNGLENGFSVQSNLNRHIRTLHRDTLHAKGLDTKGAANAEDEKSASRIRRTIQWVPRANISH